MIRNIHREDLLFDSTIREKRKKKNVEFMREKTERETIETENPRGKQTREKKSRVFFFNWNLWHLDDSNKHDVID